MIGFGLRALGSLTLLFTLIMGIIRSQPRDDAALRAFFSAPESCAAPCFMGIRPGVTTRDEALAILKARSDVVALSEETGLDNLNYIYWGWKNTPAGVTGFDGDVPPGQINMQKGIVSTIILRTAISWSDFFLTFGTPDQEFSSTYEYNLTHWLSYSAFYLRDGFEIDELTRCPFKRRSDLWYGTINVSWSPHWFGTIGSPTLGNC